MDDYILDCVRKVGPGQKLTLNREQTTVLQGMAAGQIDSGKALALLKKDIFKYGKMSISDDLYVPEVIQPLELDESMHVALRGILGMSGELADIMENIYLWFKGNELDKEKLKTDLGDLSFYASLLLNLIETDWDELHRSNKAKTDLINNEPDQL